MLHREAGDRRPLFLSQSVILDDFMLLDCGQSPLVTCGACTVALVTWAHGTMVDASCEQHP